MSEYDVLINKWARKKLTELEYSEDRLPSEDVIVNVSFTTERDGCCDMCHYDEEVVEISWGGGRYTFISPITSDLSIFLDEVLDTLN